MTDKEKQMMMVAKKKAAEVSGREVIKVASQLRELSAEEELFCREFAASGDRHKALEVSGYKGKRPGVTASRWLQKSNVQKRVAALRTQHEARLNITRDIYLGMLQETYERAMADGDYAGANRALELMGKAQGYFVEQKAVLNMTAKMPGDKAQQIAEVQRLAKIAGVSFE